MIFIQYNKYFYEYESNYIGRYFKFLFFWDFIIENFVGGLSMYYLYKGYLVGFYSYVNIVFIVI